jgi:predicted phosphoserine aminotransferase
LGYSVTLFTDEGLRYNLAALECISAILKEAPLNDDRHIRLVIPGPVEVRKEILDAQTQWMIGHRQTAFVDLYASIMSKLQQAFFTENMVLMSTSSGTGLWEAASRNCVRDDRKVLHLVNGAFSDRWAKVSEANGKKVDVIEVAWGEAVHPEMVAQQLENERYDAVAVVHNETSTGVLNPVKAIGEIVHQYDDTLYLVDCVSSFLGAELLVDEWGIDMALTSSQKAFALPPGLSFCTISPRILERAAQVPYRGYYFDLIELAKLAEKNNTPATPPISTMYAADVQLTDIMNEGVKNRWQRHLKMRDMTAEWAASCGFDLFAEEGFRSPTVTTVSNTREVDLKALSDFMKKEKCFAMDTGYGQLKGKAFRVAHMGDMSIDTLREFLAGIDEYLTRSA